MHIAHCTLHIAHCTIYFKLYSKLCLFNNYKILFYLFVKSLFKFFFEFIKFQFAKSVYLFKYLYKYLSIENNGSNGLLFKNISKFKETIMSNFYQGVNIKSISLFILTIITLAACSKQDPTKFKPSQLNGTWTGSTNPNALVVNTTKDTFQYGDMSCIDMPQDFSSIKDNDTTNYVLSFSYIVSEPNGTAFTFKTYNVRISFTSDSECEVSDERYFSETFKKTGSQDETTFDVSSLAGSGGAIWKSADGTGVVFNISTEGKISGDGSSSSDIFIDKEIPNWKTTTDKVPEFEFEINHNAKIYKFRFISSTKGYINDKLYYRQ